MARIAGLMSSVPFSVAPSSRDSIRLQTKILRVVEEQEFECIGGHDTIRLSVRIITATNRDLRKAIRGKQFRGDLNYRDRIERADLPQHIRDGDGSKPDDDNNMRSTNGDRELRSAMRQYNGGRVRVARALGISCSTLWRRLKQLQN